MITTLKILLLAVLFVATGGAAFNERFKRHPILGSLAVAVAIVGSIYLGRSIYDDLVEDVSAAQPIRENSIYTNFIPRDFTTGDRWGEFSIDGNCHLKFLNTTIAEFEYIYREPKSSCSYFPLFSASPSGNIVFVFIAIDDYGHSAFSVVDTAGNEVLINQKQIVDSLWPSDTWSDNEEQVLVHRRVVLEEYRENSSIAWGLQPCIVTVRTGEIRCADSDEFIRSAMASVHQIDDKGVCIMFQTCYLEIGIRGARFEEGAFKVTMEYDLSESDSPAIDRPMLASGVFQIELPAD